MSESLVSRRAWCMPLSQFSLFSGHIISAQFFILKPSLFYPEDAPFNHIQLSLKSAKCACSVSLTATSACLCSCLRVCHRIFLLGLSLGSAWRASGISRIRTWSSNWRFYTAVERDLQTNTTRVRSFSGLIQFEYVLLAARHSSGALSSVARKILSAWSSTTQRRFGCVIFQRPNTSNPWFKLTVERSSRRTLR